jgi:hypothetical protein
MPKPTILDLISTVLSTTLVVLNLAGIAFVLTAALTVKPQASAVESYLADPSIPHPNR